MSVQGIKELAERLEGLAYGPAARASRKAIRAGMNVVKTRQQAALPPPHNGLLKRSMGARVVKAKAGKETAIRAKAGMNVGKERPPAEVMKTPAFKKTGKYAPHAHLFALGSGPRVAGLVLGRDRVRGKKSVLNDRKDRLTGKRIAWRGIMPANAAVRRASEAAEPEAVAKIAEVLAVEIPAEIRKAGGR